jgi:hypothetical protein
MRFIMYYLLLNSCQNVILADVCFFFCIFSLRFIKIAIVVWEINNFCDIWVRSTLQHPPPHPLTGPIYVGGGGEGNKIFCSDETPFECAICVRPLTSLQLFSGPQSLD